RSPSRRPAVTPRRPRSPSSEDAAFGANLEPLAQRGKRPFALLHRTSRALSHLPRYAEVVGKIIREILNLLWKVIREVFWKWLKPLLARVLVMAVLVITIITMLVMIFVRGC